MRGGRPLVAIIMAAGPIGLTGLAIELSSLPAWSQAAASTESLDTCFRDMPAEATPAST